MNPKTTEFVLKTIMEVAKVIHELFTSKSDRKDSSDEKNSSGKK